MTAKDEVLAVLADRANVAQFVSFAPADEPRVRFSRMRHRDADRPEPVDDAVRALLARAESGTVNVRTFRPHASGAATKGTPFHYALTSVDEVLPLLRGYARDGFSTIVNETIDVADGGVSGVAMGGAVEFAPDDTPRCVDKPGTTALPAGLGLPLLATVYGFRPELPALTGRRVEFSIHPLRVGLRRTHTLLWEEEVVPEAPVDSRLLWPNHFSRLLGDKVFGLLVAHVHGVPVPATTVVSRRVAPFGFGLPTGTAEHWLRTAPAEPVPGYYPTTFGWRDPYHLLAEADPKEEVAAVLAQDSVDAAHSGAALGTAGDVLVEGVAGRGDDFMLGQRAPEDLPPSVLGAVEDLAGALVPSIGALRLEWVHDGERAWVVQLQQLPSTPGRSVIVPGDPGTWRTFRTADGLDALRTLIAEVNRTGEGILLEGGVGITSHFGDLLRRAGVPSRLLAVG